MPRRLQKKKIQKCHKCILTHDEGEQESQRQDGEEALAAGAAARGRPEAGGAAGLRDLSVLAGVVVRKLDLHVPVGFLVTLQGEPAVLDAFNLREQGIIIKLGGN